MNNRYNSLLGSLLWTYRTWTEWCWRRLADPPYNYNVTPGWNYINDDPCWAWQGQVNMTTKFYDWAAGYAPKSGYRHYRMGHTKGECIFPNNRYPENWI